METITYQGQLLRRWQIGASSYLAWPEKGARLLNWNLAFGDGSLRDVVHWPDPADWAQPAKIRGGNPILFPFAGRCFADGREGAWKWDGVERPMPRHGFARAGDFILDHLHERGFTAILRPTAADRAAYPFDYRFSVVYRFAELSFTVELRLQNEGSAPMPWSPGHHFYFTLPWHAGLARADYRAVVPAKKAWYHAADGRLTPAGEFEPEWSLAEAAAVDRIHTHLRGPAVRFGPKGGEEDIEIRLVGAPVPAQDAAVVTWTESADAPFYCVEPWMGPPNAPAHGKGLQTVPPGTTASWAVEVALA